MKAKSFNIVRYDADDGFCFDWKNLEEHQIEGEFGEIIQEHLYVKTLFIGANDSIDNYVEIEVE